MAGQSSGIRIVEESPQVRNIAGVSTAILLALGITERGPFDPTLVSSYAEFKKVYGRHITSGDLSHAVQGYFDEGGQACYVKRVVHHTDITDASTKTSEASTENLASAASSPSAGSVTGSLVGPWELEAGATLVFSVDGGGDDTATFDATAASRTGAATAPYALADGDTLTVAIDGGSVQTIEFETAEFANIATATAAEVVAVINAKITGAHADVSGGAPRITSDTKGTGSSVNVSGGTANAELGFTTGAIAGTGDAANIAAITFAEAKALIEADVAGVTVTEEDDGTITISSNTTGASSSVLVKAASTADTAFGLDNATHSGSTGAAVDCIQVDAKTDGTYGDLIEVTVEDATNGDADDFNLVVTFDGDIVETWENLSVDADSTSFCETLVNDESTGSDYIVLTTLVDDLRPANADITLSGGDDGLASIADTDFTGNSAARTGLHGFTVLDEGSLMICPDRATATVQVAMVNYCTNTKGGAVFPVLDSPEGYTVAQARTYVKTTAGLKNLSEFGAFYYPRIKVTNPNKSLFGNTSTITIPPSGHIAGVMARVDGARTGGVYDAPAGTERGVITAAVGLETDATLEESARDLLYPDLINPINIIGGSVVLDGCRTLKSNGNFPSIPERRGVIFIEQSLKAGLEFARFQNNDAKLRATVNRTMTAFLLTQMRVGAFRSQKPSEAFFVDTSEKYNPVSAQFAGRLTAVAGLATQKPSEFIELRISQDTRALDRELASN